MTPKEKAKQLKNKIEKLPTIERGNTEFYLKFTIDEMIDLLKLRWEKQNDDTKEDIQFLEEVRKELEPVEETLKFPISRKEGEYQGVIKSPLIQIAVSNYNELLDKLNNDLENEK